MADSTGYINTQFARPEVYSLTIGSVLTVDGTVNIPEGKYLKFNPGGKITGAGTINGGIIDASKWQHIFDITLTINPENCINGYFSGRWFGAIPSIQDNQPQLQKAIDTCIKSELPKLNIPRGVYNISKGLLIYKGANLQCQLNMYGDDKSRGPDLAATIINCTHNDNFGIGIYIGKSCVIKNISICGVNKLNYSLSQAHSLTATYLINGSRDNRYSPYAGICLDPFHANTPIEDRYPGFEQYYDTATTGGGSTSCIIKNVGINGFTVARVLSPNGTTQNNESHLFAGCWIGNCRESYVSCNSQERNVEIRDECIWNSVQTCYATNRYGAMYGDPPVLNNINIAGNIFELIDWPLTGYSPLFTASNIHAESIYRIGTSIGHAKISNSKFHLQDPNQYGERMQEWIYYGVGTFDTCQIYHYNDKPHYPVRFKCFRDDSGTVSFSFSNCAISLLSCDGKFSNYFIFYNCWFYMIPGSTGPFHQTVSGQNYNKFLLNTGDTIVFGENQIHIFTKQMVENSIPKTVQLVINGIEAECEPLGYGIGSPVYNETGQIGRIKFEDEQKTVIEQLVEGVEAGSQQVHTIELSYFDESIKPQIYLST